MHGGTGNGKSDLIKKATKIKIDKRSHSQTKNGDILLTMIGMLTLGHTEFDYMNKEYYKMSLGIAHGIPAESTLKMRLDVIGQTMNEDIIEIYYNHAICEQFHSEIKTDMGIGRLSGGKFDTNALILKLGMISYNVLRIIGHRGDEKA